MPAFMDSDPPHHGMIRWAVIGQLRDDIAALESAAFSARMGAGGLMPRATWPIWSKARAARR